MPRPKKSKAKTSGAKASRFELVARVRGKHAEIVKVPIGAPAEGELISRLPGRVPTKTTKLRDPALGQKLEAAFRNAVKHSLQKG